MHSLIRPSLLSIALKVILALFLSSDCAAGPAPSVFRNLAKYQPAPSPVSFDLTVAVQAEYDISPDNRAAHGRKMSAANIEHYRLGVIDAIQADIRHCGLFSRVAEMGSPRTDFLLKVRGREIHPSDFRVEMEMSLVEVATRLEISNRTRSLSIGPNGYDYVMNSVIELLMKDLKTDMIADLQSLHLNRMHQTANASAPALQKTSLPELLVASDKTAFIARERNRVLVAAKIQQLPAILRDSNSGELSALLVRIEQNMLDLNHECETAKDRIQDAIATGELSPAPASASGILAKTQMEELRNLALCYRERIELLKPIASAIKEELANRNR